MLTLTDTARARLVAAMKASSLEGYAVRLRILGRGLEGFRYDFRSVRPDDRTPEDRVVETPDFPVYIDPDTAACLEGSVIDLKEGRLRIDNPNPLWTSDLQREVAEVIERQINPGAGTHGGQISLFDVRDDVAYITMSGGCQGCSMARQTLQQGVERLIREAVPAIRQVVDMTEHAAGLSPYYRDAVGQSPLAQPPAG